MQRVKLQYFGIFPSITLRVRYTFWSSINCFPWYKTILVYIVPFVTLSLQRYQFSPGNVLDSILLTLSVRTTCSILSCKISGSPAKQIVIPTSERAKSFRLYTYIHICIFDAVILSKSKVHTHIHIPSR